MAKRTFFNKSWKDEAPYKSWLQEDEFSNLYFKCSKCQVKLELGNMGKGALNKHMKSRKHMQVHDGRQSKSAQMLTSWSRPPQLSYSSATIACSETSQEPLSNPQLVVDPETSAAHQGFTSETSVNKWVTSESVLKAETIWALNATVNHFSHNSSRYTSPIFSTMFPDSEIAKQFTCGRSKLSYITSFGLAPYFHEQLLATISDVPFHSLSFDESFNSVTKNEQLDIAVRFWDVKLSKSVTRYFGSEYLGHSTAEDLLRCFNRATASVDHSKMINLSMDGPAVNHKFMRLFQEQRAEQCVYIYYKYCISMYLTHKNNECRY